MRLTTGFLLWLIAAGVAVAVGLAAVAAIGTDLFGDGRDPLSQSEVDELLSSRAQAPSTTDSPPSSTSSSPPAPQPIVTDGGTVNARCTENGLVEIQGATPAQGFQVDADDGVEDHPSVEFESDDRKIEVRLRCVNGALAPEIKY